MSPMIRVKANETFDAALEGIEVVHFRKGEVFPRALDAEHVTPWISNKRLVDVTATLAKEEAAQKALRAKQEAEKAEEERKAAEAAQKAKEEADRKAAAEAAGAAGLPGPEALQALNKESLIKQAEAEKVAFEETWNKAKIVEAILAARSAK